MNQSTIQVAEEGAVARIVLDRPERRNALTMGMLQKLHDSLREVAGKTGIKVAIIGAAGPVFCSGHDLKELKETDRARRQEIFATCTEMMTFLKEMPQTVIAQVQGLATAAGCQLVASCDLAVASEQSAFATPGVKIGFFCSTPMVPLSRRIGVKKALEMLLTGDPISADEALRCGLVNRVVPHGSLERETMALAMALAAHSRKVLAEGKRAFYRQLELSEGEAYRWATRAMVENAELPEAVEGIGAFLQKRPPRWE